MRRALPALLAVLLAGCLGSSPPAEPASEPVPFRTLLVERSLHLLDEDGLIGEISEPTWNETWARYAAGHDPRPAKPTVDFAKERVFVASSGPFGTGCHDTRVAEARIDHEEQRDTFVLVAHHLDAEGADRICTAQVTWPTHVIAATIDTYPRWEERTFGPEDDWPHEPWTGPHVERLEARTLDKGSFSPVGEDTRALLRDAAAWSALWARHRPAEAVPAVDFASEMVVAVVVHGPTGCGQMHLGDITHDADAMAVTIEVVVEVPPPEVRCLVAFQDVYHFVAVPSRAGEARFTEVEEPAAP